MFARRTLVSVTSLLSFTLGMILLLGSSAAAQTVISRIVVGQEPDAVAVNPVTNKIYVANYQDATVTVIDGTSNTIKHAGITVGFLPSAIAVNTITNRVYVANKSSDSVTVIDGSNDSVLATVPTGNGPVAIAVNPATNRVYTANFFGDSVTMIDGNNVATTIAMGGIKPAAIAVDEVLDLVYVANENSQNVTVANGDLSNWSALFVGLWPRAIAVDAKTGRAYVAALSGTVLVIDPIAVAVTSLTAGFGSAAITVNSVTGRVYVANAGTDDVTIIEGMSVIGTVRTGAFPIAITADAATNRIYVANRLGTDPLTVIDGESNVATNFSYAALNPWALALNPVTHLVYVANVHSNDVTVIDGRIFPTTTTLASSQNPALPGQNVSFTATVTSGSGTPAGTVDFYVDSTMVASSVLNAAGQAIFTISRPIGTYTVTADYPGDRSLSLGPSSATLVQQFTPAATTTTLTSSQNPSLPLQNVNFTAMVTSGSGTPTGTVDFHLNGILLASRVLNAAGQATFTAARPAGAYTITASYRGNSNFDPSTGTLVQEFTRAATTTTWTSTQNPSLPGQSVTFTATVISGSGTPTGVVDFFVNFNPVFSGVLNAAGQANFTTSFPAGTYNITSSYRGSSTFAPSTSIAATQVVGLPEE